MKEYLGFMVGMTLLSSLASFASYKLSDKRLRFGIGIVFLCAVSAPLISVLRGIEDIKIDFSQGMAENLYEQTAKEALCAGLSQSIGEEFSLSKNEVSVICYGFSLEEMRAERIKVILSGGAAFADRTAIRAFVEGGGFGECEVIYGFG